MSKSHAALLFFFKKHSMLMMTVARQSKEVSRSPDQHCLAFVAGPGWPLPHRIPWLSPALKWLGPPDARKRKGTAQEEEEVAAVVPPVRCCRRTGK
jgi:hypothetical protein